MKTAYILIDFENVQPDKIGALGDGAFKIKVFVGAKQSRVTFGMASALQALGSAAEYVQISGSGRNALDLHIAYTIGRLAAQEPDAVFHIISKDTDFDPLIAYLKTKKIVCQRWAAVTDVPHPRHAAKPAPAKTAAKAPAKAALKPPAKPAAKAAKAVSERVDEVIRNLEKRERARPATAKALASTIKALYRDGITNDEVAAVVEALKQRGVVAIDGDRVRYQVA